MPPALDTPSEVGAVLVAVLGVLGTVGVGIIGAVAMVYGAWRAKLRPILMETKAAANAAAHQLENNSGSSTKDAVDRIEAQVAQVARDIRYLRGNMRSQQTSNDDIHRDHSQRLRALETPHERTHP